METLGATESSRGNIRFQSAFSRTACLRCREQKLRCSRERSGCARCQRLETSCSYPSPPDRRGPRGHRGPRLLNKGGTGRSRDRFHAVSQHACDELLATQASVIEAQRPGQISRHRIASPFDSHETLECDTRPGSGAELNQTSAELSIETPVLSDSYPAQLRKICPIATEPVLSSDHPPLPPTALGLSLLEIYFTRIYNAPLMFDKPTLFQQYLEGGLHSALLRALLALATLFLQPNESSSEDHHVGGHEELKVLSPYYSYGLP